MKNFKKYGLALVTLVSFSGALLAAPSTAPGNAPGRGQFGGLIDGTRGQGNGPYSNPNAGGGSSNGGGWTNSGTGGGNMGPGDGQDNRPGLGANQGCPAWMTGCRGSNDPQRPNPPEPPGQSVLRDPPPQNLEIMITRDGNLDGSASECGGQPENCHNQANDPNATGLQFVDVTGQGTGGNGLMGLPEGMGSMLKTTIFTERGGLNVGR